MLALRAFLVGLLRGLTSLRLLFMLFVVNAAFGCAWSATVADAIRDSVVTSPFARGLLERFDEALVQDWLRVNDVLVGIGSAQIGPFRILALFIATFILGGVYSGLANPSNLQNFMAFFAQCGRRFRFFVLALVPAIAVAVALGEINDLASRGVTALIHGPLQNAASAWTLTALLHGKTLLFTALFVLLVLAPLQLSRVRAVVDEEPSVLRAYARSVAFAFRHPFTILLYYALSAILFAVTLFGLGTLIAQLSPNALVRPLESFGWHWNPEFTYGVAVVLLALIAVGLQQVAILQRISGLLRIHRTLALVPRGPTPVRYIAPLEPDPKRDRAPTQRLDPIRGYAVVDEDPGTEGDSHAR